MATPNDSLDPINPQDPTAGYRPKPRGPNFLGIVVLSGIVIIVIMILAVLVLRKGASTMAPHKANPTPNSHLTLPLSSPGSLTRA